MNSDNNSYHLLVTCKWHGRLCADKRTACINPIINRKTLGNKLSSCPTMQMKAGDLLKVRELLTGKARTQTRTSVDSKAHSHTRYFCSPCSWQRGCFESKWRWNNHSSILVILLHSSNVFCGNITFMCWVYLKLPKMTLT